MMRLDLTIAEQAEYILDIVRRMQMQNGEFSDETWLRLTKEDGEILDGIVHRLNRIAPHEAAVRDLVRRG